MIKLLQLKIRRFYRSTFQRKGFWLSFFLLVFSFVVLIMILFPVIYDRVPLYSYFVREWKLPVAYELDGQVEIVDAAGNVVNTNVEVFIGGYSTSVDSNGQFKLVFSAPLTTELFIVIRYTTPSGQNIVKTELLVIKEGVHKIEQEFKYNA